MTDREKLIGLLLDIEQARILRTPLTDCVDHLIANGVVFLEEIEELKADNERLRDMWAKAVSELSRAKAERPQGEWVKHKKIRGFVYCGNCKDVYIDEEWLADGKWSFCPNCGSDIICADCKDFDGSGGVNVEIKTNADRIRAMSDEELAVFLCGIAATNCCGACMVQEFCYAEHNGFADWLRQPVKDGDNNG